jgi:hypothetical protein
MPCAARFHPDYAVLKRRRSSMAFSSDADAGSREENASNKTCASVLMPSEPNMR